MAKFLSRQETADALGLSLSTVVRRIADDSLPHVRLGRRILIPAEAVDKLSAKALSEHEGA